jgi:ATP-dependent helicase HepA
LFRIGNPLVELLRGVLTIDDRGQASAIWRPGRPAGSVYFGFDLLVEADVDPALAHREVDAESGNAIRRQADLLLPPFATRVWLDPRGVRVTDQALLAWLNAPYTKPRDVNLNLVRIAPLLDSFGGVERFATAARRAETMVRRRVLEDQRLLELTAAAQREGRRVLAIQRAQALARRSAGRLLSDTESYLADVDLHQALVDGFQTPKIGVLAATCITSGDLWGTGRVPR